MADTTTWLLRYKLAPGGDDTVRHVKFTAESDHLAYWRAYWRREEIIRTLFPLWTSLQRETRR
jgi:hypothetical protein